MNLGERSKKQLPRIVLLVFLLFSGYLALPLIDVPFMGLSLSAPLFFVIAFEAIFRPPERWFYAYRRWILLAAAIWIGIFVSAAANGLLSNGLNIDTDGILTVIRYAYWLFVFVVTAYLVSRAKLILQVNGMLAFSIAGLGILRMVEAIFFGRIGAWSHTRFLEQNSYGFLFSCFSIILFSEFIRAKSWKKVFLGLLGVNLLVAILINGSRGSWVGVLASSSVFILLNSTSKRTGAIQVLASVAVIGSLAAGFLLSDQKLLIPFLDRYATFSTLEDDKSYAIRQLMNQKGIRLFLESPIIGVGPSRFTQSSTSLDIPRILSYASQEHFDRKSAHNSYVGFLSETGLVGSIPLAILLLVLAIRGLRASTRLSVSFGSSSVAIFACFVGMSVHLWGINTLTNTCNWFIYGLVAALIVLDRNKVTGINSNPH